LTGVESLLHAIIINNKVEVTSTHARMDEKQFIFFSFLC
jgi:hypothetical protein